MFELSVVIPWCDRAELPLCLSSLEKLRTTLSLDILVVREGGDLAELHRLLAGVPFVSVRIVDLGAGLFNKCRCLNVGASLARFATLFLCDSDILVERSLVDNALQALRAGTFITVREGIETDPATHPEVLHALPCLTERVVTTELMFLGGARASFELRQTPYGRSLCGLMFLAQADYIQIGGCNSELTSWGFEDYDLQIRLQAGLNLAKLSLGSAVHATHTVIEKSLRNRTNTRNALRAFERYNKGDFGGTYVKDVAESYRAVNYGSDNT